MSGLPPILTKSFFPKFEECLDSSLTMIVNLTYLGPGFCKTSAHRVENTDLSISAENSTNFPG